ncbi:MAG: ADP-ribosyltransferase [Myxococcaceae bacterium]
MISSDGPRRPAAPKTDASGRTATAKPAAKPAAKAPAPAAPAARGWLPKAAAAPAAKPATTKAADPAPARGWQNKPAAPAPAQGWQTKTAAPAAKPGDGFATAPARSRTPAPASAPAAPAAPRPPPAFDGSPDATALYKAMHGGLFGAGTDEAAVHQALDGKTPAQLDSIKKSYSDHFKRDLTSDLKSELGGGDLTRALAQLKGDPVAASAEKLHNALAGFGTAEAEVFATLEGKKPKELADLKQRFEQKYGSLDKALSRELGGDELVRARALLAGDSAGAEAAKLHHAVAGLGTDEQAILQTLEGKSPTERAAITASYQKQYGTSLKAELKGDLSGAKSQLAMALLEGDKSRAAAAKLADAMKGPGTHEQAIFQALEGTSAAERGALAASFQKLSGRELTADLKKELGGSDLKRAESLLANGKISDADELHLAMNGLGTDESKIKQTLSGRTKAEIDQLKSDYRAKYGSDLMADLKKELGGRDAHDVGTSLQGVPTSPEEALKRMNEARSFERGGWKNAASAFLLDGLTGKGKLLDGNIERANAFYAEAMKDGKLAPAESKRLAQLIGYTQDDVAIYRTAKDSAASGAATIATTAAAVGVAVAPAGAGTPLVVAALAGAGAGAGSRVLAKGLISGEGYSLGDAATDGAIGAVEGAASLLAAGAARKVVSGAMGSVIKAAETSTAARVAVSAANGAAQGAVSGGLNGAGNAAFTDGTWDGGLAEGLGTVAVAGAKGAVIGAVTSGTLGAVKGLIPPKVVYVTQSEVADEKLDLTKYRSDATTRTQVKEWLASDAKNYSGTAEQLQASNPALANIPREDLAALKAYTGDYYRDMNTALRGKTDLWGAKPGLPSGVKGAASALNQLPSHQGTVFRGANLDPSILDRYVEGKVIAEKAFMSTTVDQNVAKTFGNANTLFVINSVKNGRDVSMLSDYVAEKEVLFSPGTAFKVLSKDVDKLSGRTTIFLSEVP